MKCPTVAVDDLSSVACVEMYQRCSLRLTTMSSLPVQNDSALGPGTLLSLDHDKILRVICHTITPRTQRESD